MNEQSISHSNEWQPPTPEEVDRINRHYNIRLFFGTHGFNNIDSRTASLDLLSLRPTQEEYLQAEQATEGLIEGDVLFHEGYGNGGNIQEPLPYIDPESSPFPAAAMLANQSREETRQSVIAHRNAYTMNAWQYAEWQARFNGARTVTADTSLAMSLVLQLVYGGKGMLQLMTSPDKADQERASMIHRLREETAYRTVVDYARANLPTTDTSGETIEKRNLHLLWGAGHEPAIRQKFENIGIEATTVLLKQTDLETRKTEHLVDLAMRTTANAMMQMLQNMPFRAPFTPEDPKA